MVIYTKRGDKGETCLFDNSTVSKSSEILNAIGSIDELNALLGMVTSTSSNKYICRNLTKIQKNLMIISSIIAGKNLNFSLQETKKIEKQIDKLESQLPKLNNFIIPGGTKESSMLQYIRAVARRAERFAVSVDEEEKNKNILAYMNRLSDFLFILARKTNPDLQVEDVVWTLNKSK